MATTPSTPEPELVDTSEQFLKQYYEDDIAELAQHYPQEKKSLWVDFYDVLSFDPVLADDLVSNPDRVREHFEAALADYQLPVDITLSNADVRFYNLDETKHLHEIRDKDVEKLCAVTGQISKATAVRPVVKEAAWECQRCGKVTHIPVEDSMREPGECQACTRQGPFVFNYPESEVKNHQLIRIKQPPEEATNTSQVGNELDAHIEGGLAGEVSAGDRADITGVIRADEEEGDPVLDFYMDAWAVETLEDDFRDLNIDQYRDRLEEITQEENPFINLAESIAPGITGGRTVDIKTPWGELYDKYWWVRLATGIANLFGSWRRPNGDGTYQRGSSHTLYIGDPSTGKSSIMNAIDAISPRSAFESGKNASGAGLTAAAINDEFGDSQWSLEAGALVKAHNGVACIDEIDKMRNEDLDRLHSALENEKLEFNKAGIDTTLRCETSLLAAGNPEDSRFGNYDSDLSQIDIVGSLLDRFDLVFTFKDEPDKSKDEKVADSAIDQRIESGLVAKDELESEERSAANAAVDVETMRAWVAHARQNYDPVIRSDAVKERLKEYYINVRAENENEDGDAVPATVRTLDGLLRLSEASARMRLSEEVEEIDAEMAIALLKVSLEDIGIDPESGLRDVDFANGRGSWAQRDRRQKLKGIVENLQGDDGADIDNVVETAVDAGISESMARKDLEELRHNGTLYEPATGKLRMT